MLNTYSQTHTTGCLMIIIIIINQMTTTETEIVRPDKTNKQKSWINKITSLQLANIISLNIWIFGNPNPNQHMEGVCRSHARVSPINSINKNGFNQRKFSCQELPPITPTHINDDDDDDDLNSWDRETLNQDDCSFWWNFFFLYNHRND